jgi:predicted phage-related endonuclease
MTKAEQEKYDQLAASLLEAEKRIETLTAEKAEQKKLIDEQSLSLHKAGEDLAEHAQCHTKIHQLEEANKELIIQLDDVNEKYKSVLQELEVASERPVTEAEDSKKIKPGIYLKDNRLHIAGFGLIEKSSGPLTEAQVKALIDMHDPSEGWTKEKVAKRFLVVVEE